MTKHTKYGLIAATIASTTALTPALAEEATVATPSTFSEALSASKPLFGARLRYETVDQDGIAETADALTYRFRVGVETGEYLGTKFLVDFDHVEDIVDDFNSTTNGNSGFPVVADPNVTELNRLQLTNTSLPGTTVTLGRQKIILDGARFVGNVGWRQNEQTFDGLRVVNTSVDNLKFDFSYITRVNRIFGDEHPTNGHWTGDTYLANISYDTPAGKITGFGYFIDSDEAAALSSQTIGAKLAGKQGVGPGKLSYNLSYAVQSDFGSSNLDYETDYFLADFGYGINKFSAGIGYEVLGSDDGVSFKTPLATGHKFQGWADKFLATPANGLEDIYLTAGYKVGDIGPFKGWGLKAIYHDFSATEGSADYGSEIDFVTSAKVGKYKLTLKYADYSADELATDTTKVWAQIDFAF